MRAHTHTQALTYTQNCRYVDLVQRIWDAEKERDSPLEPLDQSSTSRAGTSLRPASHSLLPASPAAVRPSTASSEAATHRNAHAKAPTHSDGARTRPISAVSRPISAMSSANRPLSGLSSVMQDGSRTRPLSALGGARAPSRPVSATYGFIKLRDMTDRPVYDQFSRPTSAVSMEHYSRLSDTSGEQDRRGSDHESEDEMSRAGTESVVS